MNIYTHWLVTIGTGPVRGTKFTPIILVQKSYYSTALLRKVVAEKVDKLNTLLLSPEAPSTALFNELANPGALRRTTDLICLFQISHTARHFQNTMICPRRPVHLVHGALQ